KRGAPRKLITREVAGAVFHVPARDRTGEILHQHVIRPKRRQIIFAEDQLVRRPIFEQPHRHGLGRDPHPGTLPHCKAMIDFWMEGWSSGRESNPLMTAMHTAAFPIRYRCTATLYRQGVNCNLKCWV